MIQVIKCKCGRIFASCQEPECWTDEEWQQDVRENVIKGNSIEMVKQGEWKFESCVCGNKEEGDPLQLEIDFKDGENDL